jgi:hypothetical protein
MSIAGLRGKRKREAIESIGRTLAAEMGVA